MDLTIAGLTFTPSEPDVWMLDSETSVTADAGPRTDLFVDPATGEATVNAPRLLTPAPPGDFQFSAEVSAFHAATYDAGALLIWAGEHSWAKLAFEYSPQETGMIVTVVTRGRSDDANGYTVDGLSVRLRIARVNGAYACHASIDEGLTWDFVRHFGEFTGRAGHGTTDGEGALDGGGLHAGAPDGGVAIGFEVQSPVGDGCRARFTHISLKRTTLTNLRDGS